MTQVGAYYPAATMREFASAPIEHAEHGHLSIAPSENANITHTATIAPVTKSYLPGSQESIHSIVSSTFSAPALPSSSSNLSASTAADTDLTSLSSANVAPNQDQTTEASMSTSPSRPRNADSQARASRIDAAAANATRTGDTAASPMLLGSPVSHGFKRTADGSVKGIGLGIESTAGPATAHKRSKSMDTHAGTRIGEVQLLNRHKACTSLTHM